MCSNCKDLNIQFYEGDGEVVVNVINILFIFLAQEKMSLQIPLLRLCHYTIHQYKSGYSF